jgi:hypothetical protein
MASRSNAAAGGGDPSVNFGTRIADAQVSLGDFKSEPWTPEYGIRGDEEDAFASPHDPQFLAALRAFALMFVCAAKCVWVHLAAEMQAGKTGVIATLARLVLANASRLQFAPDRIFVVTGMSDEAWQSQTAPRMPYILRENVHHGGTLSQVSAKLIRLARGDILKNVLIFIDESHYATAATNQPAKHVYDTVARLCPRDKWVENNIRFMTISATDPAKIIAMKATDVQCQVVRLMTTDAYQSVEKLQACGRVRYLEQIPDNGTLHTATGFAALVSAVDELEAVHGSLVHIIRPQNGKGAAVADKLRARYPRAIIHQWDVASNKEKIRIAKDDASSGVGSATDINNSILNNAPEVTTFVILKGMFRAAKTLNDRYVGVMYDRVASGDATNLQSLLGRACGYGKSNRTIVFTSQNTVTNYLRCWRELCMSKTWEADNDDMAKLSGKMPHTKAVKAANGDSKFVTTAEHASPFGHGVGAASAAEIAASARNTFDDDDFTVEWSPVFHTLAEARAAGAGALRPGADGFFRNRTGRKGAMTVAQYHVVKAGNKTAHCAVPHGFTDYPVGRPTNATFAFYEDPSDPTTVRFCTKTLTRIRERRT